jgi:hypothetical protein
MLLDDTTPVFLSFSPFSGVGAVELEVYCPATSTVSASGSGGAEFSAFGRDPSSCVEGGRKENMLLGRERGINADNLFRALGRSPGAGVDDRGVDDARR